MPNGLNLCPSRMEREQSLGYRGNRSADISEPLEDQTKCTCILSIPECVSSKQTLHMGQQSFQLSLHCCEVCRGAAPKPSAQPKVSQNRRILASQDYERMQANGPPLDARYLPQQPSRHPAPLLCMQSPSAASFATANTSQARH